MKKLFYLYIIIGFQLMNAQQIEIGPYFGFNSCNIANSRITEGRAVIGKSLWSFNYGLFEAERISKTGLAEAEKIMAIGKSTAESLSVTGFRHGR